VDALEVYQGDGNITLTDELGLETAVGPDPVDLNVNVV
jgi:hypothetical protein